MPPPDVHRPVLPDGLLPVRASFAFHAMPLSVSRRHFAARLMPPCHGHYAALPGCFAADIFQIFATPPPLPYDAADIFAT
jgi:hypothetical protein